MKVDWNQLQRKLLAAARAEKQDDSVPLAFEKRIMAHMGDRRPVDLIYGWSQSLWRGALACVLITWISSLLLNPRGDAIETSSGGDFPEVFEQTVLASFNQRVEENW